MYLSNTIHKIKCKQDELTHISQMINYYQATVIKIVEEKCKSQGINEIDWCSHTHVNQTQVDNLKNECKQHIFDNNNIKEQLYKN